MQSTISIAEWEDALFKINNLERMFNRQERGYGFSSRSGARRTSGGRAARRVLRGAGRAAASIIMKRARQIARTAFQSRSGKLRRAFRIQEERRGFGGFRVIYGDIFARYAVLVEYGHDIVVGRKRVGRAEPNKVLTAAADETQAVVTQVFVAEVGRRVEREMRRIARR